MTSAATLPCQSRTPTSAGELQQMKAWDKRGCSLEQEETPCLYLRAEQRPLDPQLTYITASSNDRSLVAVSCQSGCLLNVGHSAMGCVDWLAG